MADQKQHTSRDAQPGCINSPIGLAKHPNHFLHYVAFLIFLAAISAIVGFQVGLRNGVWVKWQSASSVQAASISPSPASAPDAPKNEVDELSRLAPQQQAERLLERAIHRREGSLDLIRQNVDAWRGRLQDTDRLFDLILTALHSDDLRVRSAAVEIDLAANNLSKSSQSVAVLVQQFRENPAGHPWALWRLGALGNRGVEPQIVLALLLTYARDPKEQTRYRAVEGLAIFGSDAAIDPLLERFAHDPSPRVRKLAAASLAQSGLLTKEQRLAAVPDLLNLLDDDSLDSTTRGWVYGALRIITGAPVGNSASAWRKWWAERDTTRKQPSRRTAIVLV